MTPSSDRQLLHAWRCGCRRSGDLLFRRHYDCVLGLLRRGQPQEAEDLAQHAFLRCVERPEQFASSTSFRTYLMTVAKNAFCDQLRREGRRERLDDQPDAHATPPTSEELIDATRTRARVAAALAGLPGPLRTALIHRYWHDTTTRAFAELVGIPHGTAKSRLRRAHLALRRVLVGGR